MIPTMKTEALRGMIRAGLLLVLIAAFLSISGCRNAGRQQDSPVGLSTRTLLVDGLLRRYALYVPAAAGAGEAMPLVLELHGGGIYIEDLTGASGYKTPYKLWMDLADKEGFIVVYPQGLDGIYGKPTWNDCRGDNQVNSRANDVAFIASLLDAVASEWAVDRERVYVSGTSNGGFMALRLAQELSGRVAAVASVAAGMPAVPACSAPENPVSVLFMNGTDDNHMPYLGGYLSNPPDPAHGSVLSTPDSVRYWVEFNRVATDPLVHVFPDLDPGDGGIVERFTHVDGLAGTEVVLYRVNGGGHSAPSIRERYSALFERYFNRQNHDVEMTTELWQFFRDKTLH